MQTYSSCEFREIIKAKYTIPRMNRKGNCYDNLFIKIFFKILSLNLFILFSGNESDKDLGCTIFEYIEIWYNRKRVHSSLVYLSLFECETVDRMTA